MRGEEIKETLSHGAGAYARCSFCGRYSDHPSSLSKYGWPCDCGNSGGWSGSFVKPTKDSTWSESTRYTNN
jgi:hypothetical protein